MISGSITAEGLFHPGMARRRCRSSKAVPGPGSVTESLKRVFALTLPLQNLWMGRSGGKSGSIPAGRSEPWFHPVRLAILVFITAGFLVIGILSRQDRELILFDLLYLPAVLACIFFAKRGYVFSVIVAAGYFFLTTFLSPDHALLPGTLIQALILVFVATVITYRTPVPTRGNDRLQESEEKYQVLFENAHETIMVLQDGMIRLVNSRGSELSGYSAQELMARPFIEFVHPDDREQVAENYRKRLDGLIRESTYPVRIVTKEGKIRWIATHAVLIPWEGRPASLTYLTDITGRKQAEEDLTAKSINLEVTNQNLKATEQELRAIIEELEQHKQTLRGNEERYRLLLQNINDAIIVHDISPSGPGAVREVNDRACQLLGYTHEELLRKAITDFDIPEQAGISSSISRELLSTGRAVFETEFVTWSGKRVPVEVSVRLFTLQGKQTALAVIRDITGRKMMEESLRESEERFRKTIHLTQFGIVIIDAKTHRVLVANPKALEMIGTGGNELIGSVCHTFICPAESECCPVTDLGLTGEASERVLVSRRGEKIPIIKSVVRTMMAGKEVLIESFVDISDQKRAEAALLDRERTIHTLLNAVRDDLALINGERKFITVNGSMAEKLGYPPEALAGRVMGDFLTSSLLSENLDLVLDPENRGRQVFFEEHQSDRWLETTIYPVTDGTGTDVRIAIQTHDITDRKLVEEELKKMGLSQCELNIEKFQILNDEIRNPLQVIRAYLSLIDTEYNAEIDKQVTLIDNLVTRLDMGWLESEKVQQFLLKHSVSSQKCPREQQSAGGVR